jgi:hypothetical protein
MTMRYKPCHRPRPLEYLMLTLMLGSVGCAGTPKPTLILNAPACGTQIPESYRKPVASAPLPANPLTVGKLMAFGDAQTAKLHEANSRTKATVAIVDGCDAANANAQKAVTKSNRHKFLGIF